MVKLIDFISFLSTKLFYTSSRIIRLPIYVRGGKYISWGKKLTTGRRCRFDVFYPKNQYCIKFGSNIQINDDVHIGAVESVEIGDDTLIASKVFITDHNHGKYRGKDQDRPDSIPADRPIVSAPVKIGKNVWIGEFVAILPGVTIGDGAIIGTMSTVTSNIPQNSIAVGSPAKVIKTFCEEKQEWIKV